MNYLREIATKGSVTPMPEHAGVRKVNAASVKEACDEFFRSRNMPVSRSFRDEINGHARADKAEREASERADG